MVHPKHDLTWLSKAKRLVYLTVDYLDAVGCWVELVCPAQPMGAQSDWDLGCSEAESAALGFLAAGSCAAFTRTRRVDHCSPQA